MLGLLCELIGGVIVGLNYCCVEVYLCSDAEDIEPFMCTLLYCFLKIDLDHSEKAVNYKGIVVPILLSQV